MFVPSKLSSSLMPLPLTRIAFPTNVLDEARNKLRDGRPSWPIRGQTGLLCSDAE